MTREEAEQKAQNLTVLCEKPECGDPIPSYGQQEQRSRRQMDYRGETGLMGMFHTYVCPVCTSQQHYWVNRHLFGAHSVDRHVPLAEKLFGK